MRFAKPPQGACACECECLLAVASITPRSGGLHGSPRFLFFYDIRYNYNNIIIYNIAYGHTNTFFSYICYGGTYYISVDTAKYMIEWVYPCILYTSEHASNIICAARIVGYKLPQRNRARRRLRNNIWRRGFEETNLLSLFESSGHHVIEHLNVKNRYCRESCWSKFKKTMRTLNDCNILSTYNR